MAQFVVSIGSKKKKSVVPPATSSVMSSEMEKEDAADHRPTTLVSIAVDSLRELLFYLDPKSLARIMGSSKMLYRDGRLVASCVYRYLTTMNLSNVTLPKVGRRRKGNSSQVRYSYTQAVHEMFMNKPQEVLVMGGYEDSNKATSDVFKMIVETSSSTTSTSTSTSAAAAGGGGGGAISIRFEPCAPMLKPRGSHAAVYSQGEVFSIGNDTGRSVERFDTISCTSTLISTPLPNDLHHTTACVVDSQLYIIGGEHKIDGRWVFSDLVYMLDEDEDCWIVHPARLRIARSRAAATVIDDRIFVAGGVAGAARSVETFCPLCVQQKWQKAGHLRSSRGSFSLFVYDGELIAVGGSRANTTIERRNAETRKFECIADLGESRLGCASVLVGSKIFIFGGGGRKATWDYYDLETNTFASQEEGGAYFDKDARRMPRQVVCGSAVLCGPLETATWSDLNVEYMFDF